MNCGKILNKATGIKRNILDYIRIYYPKYAIIQNPEPGEILPEKYVVILDEYSKLVDYDILFFTCNVPDKSIPTLSDDFILDEVIDYFKISNITGTIKQRILEFANIESIYNIAFKYMITDYSIDILYNNDNINPMTFLYNKRFQLGINTINPLYNNIFSVKTSNTKYSKNHLLYLINLELEQLFLKTGNHLVIQYYNILSKSLIS